jgi:hypothetical protein
MKLIRTLRGDGVLVAENGETAVGYGLDLFETRGERVGSGTLDGDLSGLGEEPGPLRLRLVDGFEVEVRLDQLDQDGATFSTSGPLPKS